MDRIAVLDIDSIAYAIASPNKIPKGEDFERDEFGRFLYIDKTEDEIIKNAELVLNNIFKACLAENYIGFIKGKNTGKYRYAIKSDYKHNRSSERPKWWDFTANHLISNYNIHLVDNYEVDDIVNIYRLKTKNSFIVACDKDLLNLPGVHFNWRTSQWHAVDYYDAQYLFWKDMIIGQTGDGIKGLPGKGKVFADKYLSTIPVEELPKTVLEIYIENLNNGILEFSKNYSCLKILDLNDEIDYDFNNLNPVPVVKKGDYYEV